MIIAVGLAVYCLLVAVFITLFVASSRADEALEEHFEESRRSGNSKKVG